LVAFLGDLIAFLSDPFAFLSDPVAFLCERFSLLLQLSESQKRPAVGTIDAELTP